MNDIYKAAVRLLAGLAAEKVVRLAGLLPKTDAWIKSGIAEMLFLMSHNL